MPESLARVAVGGLHRLRADSAGDPRRARPPARSARRAISAKLKLGGEPAGRRRVSRETGAAFRPCSHIPPVRRVQAWCAQVTHFESQRGGAGTGTGRPLSSVARPCHSARSVRRRDQHSSSGVNSGRNLGEIDSRRHPSGWEPGARPAIRRLAGMRVESRVASRTVVAPSEVVCRVFNFAEIFDCDGTRRAIGAALAARCSVAARARSQRRWTRSSSSKFRRRPTVATSCFARCGTNVRALVQ